MEPWQVLELLSALVDKSLVTYEETEDGTGRYRLLETVRQYGAERLRETGEAQPARARHRDAFLALAQDAELGMMGPDQARWFERLEQEHDNLRAALGWCEQDANPDAGLRLAYFLWRFWEVRGHLAEGRAWFDAVLAHPAAPDAPAQARAHAAFGAAILATGQADYVRAHALFDDCLAIWREQGDAAGVAMALNDLAILTAEEGDLAGARPLLEQALARNRALGQTERAAKNLSNLGELCWYLGERDAARTYREQARELLTQQGDTRGLVVLLNNLGNAEREAGNPSTARAHLTESLRLARGLGDKKNVFTVLESFADLALDAGDANQAARLLAASEAQRVLAGVPVPAALHESHSRRRDAVRAHFTYPADFDEVWSAGSALSLDLAITLALGKDESGTANA